MGSPLLIPKGVKGGALIPKNNLMKYLFFIKAISLCITKKDKTMENYKQNTLPTILTVNDFCEKHSFLTPSALRNKIFYSCQNRMDEFKVTLKLGKRVYINEANFFSWLEAINGGF